MTVQKGTKNGTHRLGGAGTRPLSRWPPTKPGSIRDRLLTFRETGGGDHITYEDALLMLGCTRAALSMAARAMHEAGDVTVKTRHVSTIYFPPRDAGKDDLG